MLRVLERGVDAEVLALGAMSGEADECTCGMPGVVAVTGGDEDVGIGLTPIERALHDSVAAENR
ncbi:hypothetical protein NQ166_03090 [Microbacterium sp. zg.Y1090]|uniref:hypothetical protein n=1 Tax=Microbacterium TaxID=33882 RepID=UPI00214C9687|nr:MULTISPECIES: hypothetical protein [unclassified Microbacterium]MCR2812386.1 hypothetical protein [Microbacterium sp. zg.Y1084]MCR2817813.1 hypothetical protein [Microbacterium sp. zg.Y1090]MDL5485543.1 hypothetical protein [Microbacterium sp. zg-Y1211]WIM28714.1 hypothetical protein QNO26_02125 [Microbacterium sp. zg-Y1090]